MAYRKFVILLERGFVIIAKTNPRLILAESTRKPGDPFPRNSS